MSLRIVPTLFVVAAVLSAAAFAQTGSKPPAKPVRLLFAGSSSTYWNDMPSEIAKVVDGKIAGREGTPVTAEIVGRSGSDIRVYAEPGFKDYQYGVKPGQRSWRKSATRSSTTSR